MTVEDVLRERWATASTAYRKAILIVFRGANKAFYASNSEGGHYPTKRSNKFDLMNKQYNG